MIGLVVVVVAAAAAAADGGCGVAISVVSSTSDETGADADMMVVEINKAAGTAISGR